MAEIRQELKVTAARSKILESLSNAPALERWHRAHVSGGPQEWLIAYPNGPMFRWKVIATTGDQVTSRCEEEPGNAKGNEVRFGVSHADKTRTLIRLVHRERAGTDPNYEKCNTLWGVLLGRLQQEAEGLLARTHRRRARGSVASTARVVGAPARWAPYKNDLAVRGF